MTATTPRPDPRAPGEVSPTERPLARFDGAERILHWVNAALFAVLLATAAALYVPALSALVGRREVVKTIHVWSGLALPVPIAATLAAGPWGAAFRADVRRLNRWTPDDSRWLRRRGRGGAAGLGKFNPGQKLNAAFTAGAIVAMLGTGAIMRWPARWPVAYRTGATFVHDWIFLALVVTITGHIVFAMNDREALGSMRSGPVSRAWARRHAPLWLAEMSARDGVAPERSPDQRG